MSLLPQHCTPPLTSAQLWEEPAAIAPTRPTTSGRPAPLEPPPLELPELEPPLVVPPLVELPLVEPPLVEPPVELADESLPDELPPVAEPLEVPLGTLQSKQALKEDPSAEQVSVPISPSPQSHATLAPAVQTMLAGQPASRPPLVHTAAVAIHSALIGRSWFTSLAARKWTL